MFLSNLVAYPVDIRVIFAQFRRVQVEFGRHLIIQKFVERVEVHAEGPGTQSEKLS